MPVATDAAPAKAKAPARKKTAGRKPSRPRKVTWQHTSGRKVEVFAGGAADRRRADHPDWKRVS